MVFFFEKAAHISLVRFGVYPRRVEGLLGIFMSPLIHGGWEHIFANSVSLLTLMSLLFYAYRKIAKEVFTWIYFLSGIYVWIFARPSFHIGASGVVYGLIGFIVLAGILSKNIRLMAISLLVIMINAGFLWGLLPLQKGVSWESHLSGLIIGLVLAVFFRVDYQKPKRKEIPEEPISFTSENITTFTYTIVKESSKDETNNNL
jgi:membrane associated rhomboid family serine protease